MERFVYDLIAKVLSGEATANEAAQLQEARAADPAVEAAFKDAQVLWDLMDTALPRFPVDKAAAWQKIAARTGIEETQSAFENAGNSGNSALKSKRIAVPIWTRWAAAAAVVAERPHRDHVDRLRVSDPLRRRDRRRHAPDRHDLADAAVRGVPRLAGAARDLRDARGDDPVLPGRRVGGGGRAGRHAAARAHGRDGIPASSDPEPGALHGADDRREPAGERGSLGLRDTARPRIAAHAHLDDPSPVRRARPGPAPDRVGARRLGDADALAARVSPPDPSTHPTLHRPESQLT